MPKKATGKTQAKIITKDDIVLCALTLSKELGWKHVRLNDIASECGIDLVTLHDHIEDKTDILIALSRMIDRKVLSGIAKPHPETPARDALFDILMERYDVLNDHRDEIISILHSFRPDPKQAVISMPHLARSMTWMLEAAGIETGGLKGAIKVAGLTGVYLNVLRIWANDNSPDLSKTMAALDKNLGRAERCANTFGF